MNRSAAMFRQTEELDLGSGRVVEVRKPDVPRLIMESADGSVPEYLTASVLAGFKNSNGAAPQEFSLSREDLPRLSHFMDTVVRAALVWPKIVEVDPDYEAGEILITDLDTADRMAIFSWAMPEDAAAAQRFREQQNGTVPAARPGKKLPAASQ